MNLQDLNEVDLNDIEFSQMGDWPTAVKWILVVIISIAVLAAGYFFYIEAQYQQLAREERIEKDLRGQYELQYARAANLDAYKAQLVEMHESFGAMLRQLPDRTEVADLLVDVSQTGLAAGLEFELFQPQKELPQAFYAELPIKLRVVGTYHQFSHFVSGLAALPRIVTIHNVAIKAAQKGNLKDNDQKHTLVLEALAKTYRYLEEGDG